MKISKSSLFLFFKLLKDKWFLLTILLLTDPWDIMERWFNVNYKLPLWLPLLLAIAIAIIWTCCELKKQLIFKFNDNSLTTNDDKLILGINFSSSVDMTIDNLILEYNGKQFCPLDWAAFKLNRIYSKNYTFILSKIQAVSSVNNKYAKLVVTVGSIKYESSPFNIYALL